MKIGYHKISFIPISPFSYTLFGCGSASLGVKVNERIPYKTIVTDRKLSELISLAA